MTATEYGKKLIAMAKRGYMPNAADNMVMLGAGEMLLKQAGYLRDLRLRCEKLEAECTRKQAAIDKALDVLEEGWTE